MKEVMTRNKEIIVQDNLYENDFYDIVTSHNTVDEKEVVHILHACATKTVEFMEDLKEKYGLVNKQYYELALKSYFLNFTHIQQAMAVQFFTNHASQAPCMSSRCAFMHLVGDEVPEMDGNRNHPAWEEIINHFIKYEQNYKRFHGLYFESMANHGNRVDSAEVSAALVYIYRCYGLLLNALGTGNGINHEGKMVLPDTIYLPANNKELQYDIK